MINGYDGRPFKDSRYPGGPQAIPGKVYCAYYDFGGEGVAYHDTTEKNQGSGMLNPPDGTYLNEFRINESVDTTYTKVGGTDDTGYNLFQPEMGMPYVGWTEPGEWLKYTVQVKKSGIYSIDILYTSNKGGAVSLSVNGKDVTGPIRIPSTFDANDSEAWRQWHHWNRLNGAATVMLEEGSTVLTLHTIDNGQMNYAWLEFILKQ